VPVKIMYWHNQFIIVYGKINSCLKVYFPNFTRIAFKVFGNRFSKI